MLISNIAGVKIENIQKAKSDEKKHILWTVPFFCVSFFFMDMQAFKSLLKASYPSAYKHWKSCLRPPFASFDSIKLPLKAYERMETVVKCLFQLKSRPDYQNSLPKQVPAVALKSQQQDSVLMAYDFHLDKAEEPKLIEVNTNGSGFLLVNTLYQIKNLPYKTAREDLKQAFQTEWHKFNKGKKNLHQKKCF